MISNASGAEAAPISLIGTFTMFCNASGIGIGAASSIVRVDDFALVVGAARVVIIGTISILQSTTSGGLLRTVP